MAHTFTKRNSNTNINNEHEETTQTSFVELSEEDKKAGMPEPPFKIMNISQSTPSNLPTWLQQAKHIENQNKAPIKPINTEDIKDKEGRQTFKVSSLPSEFKCYPEGVEVRYSNYEFDDFEIINNDLVDLYDRYAQMLKGIVTKGMSKQSLTFGDFLFISVQRKLNAFGAKTFKIPYWCPHCKQDGEYTFSLEDIAFEGLKYAMPLKVRFYSYPDEEYLFQPHTIGDVLMMLENEVYYQYTEDGVLVQDVQGNPIQDVKSVLASSCVNLDFNTAYQRIASISDYRDYETLTQLSSILYHGLSPFEFTCQNIVKFIPSDSSKQVNENNVSNKEEKEDDSNSPILPFSFLDDDTVKCNHNLRLDIKKENVLVIPFRESTESNEYGIIFSD
jgi:hypothetical protein